MDEQERIESHDDDVEGQAYRRKALAANEEPPDDDEGDDVEGHILHRPTTM